MITDGPQFEPPLIIAAAAAATAAETCLGWECDDPGDAIQLMGEPSDTIANLAESYGFC